MNWPVFFKRLGTAVFFCAVIMAAVLTTFEVMLAVALIIHFFAIKEFFNLGKRIYPDAIFPSFMMPLTLAFGTLISLVIAIATSIHDYIFGVFLVPIILIFIGTMQQKTALTSSLVALSALLYISLPIGFLMSLYMLFKSNVIAANIPLALILLIWTNDTMAYITGSFIGKTPFSKISPKKTWEGTIGGVVFTVIAVLLIDYLGWLPSLKTQDWIVLALLASIVGTAGDLFESKLKRLADVKDSGNILPGHGGALDRFDSLFFALPFAFVYVMMYMI